MLVYQAYTGFMLYPQIIHGRVTEIHLRNYSNGGSYTMHLSVYARRYALTMFVWGDTSMGPTATKV